MIYPSILERRYQEYIPLVREAGERVKSTLLNFCEMHGYAFIYRCKTVESLAEKIETGRFKAWSEIDDLFACTIIIPTLSSEHEVINFCETTFSRLKIIKRGQNRKSPESFIFDSTRINAKLTKPEGLDLGSTLSIFDVKFEIQIKSAFEHAWSVSTHALAYKSSQVDWKRLRLAAQMKATVEQLDTLILGFEQASTNIQESPFPDIKDKCRIAETVNKLVEVGKIPTELQPKDMSRFCDNLFTLIKSANPENNIGQALKKISSEVNSTPTNRIPLSISLLQYFFAILVSKKVIVIPENKYTCHITEELITLYPELADTELVFKYYE